MAGRKPSLDPSYAMSIYPPLSLVNRLDAIAEREKRKRAEMAVMLLEGAIELDESSHKPAEAK